MKGEGGVAMKMIDSPFGPVLDVDPDRRGRIVSVMDAATGSDGWLDLNRFSGLLFVDLEGKQVTLALAHRAAALVNDVNQVFCERAVRVKLRLEVGQGAPHAYELVPFELVDPGRELQALALVPYVEVDTGT
jgi:hypothetical protein